MMRMFGAETSAYERGMDDGYRRGRMDAERKCNCCHGRNTFQAGYNGGHFAGYKRSENTTRTQAFAALRRAAEQVRLAYAEARRLDGIGQHGLAMVERWNAQAMRRAIRAAIGSEKQS